MLSQRTRSRVEAWFERLTAAPARSLLRSPLPDARPSSCQPHAQHSCLLVLPAAARQPLPVTRWDLCQLHSSPHLPRGSPTPLISALLSRAEKSFNGMPKINFPTESLSPELSVCVRCGLIFVFQTVCIFFLCKGILLLVHRLRCSCKQKFASDTFDHNFLELKSLNENI